MWIAALLLSSRRKPSKSLQLWVLLKVCYSFDLSQEPSTAFSTASSDFPCYRQPWLPRTGSVSEQINDALLESARPMTDGYRDFLRDGMYAPGPMIIFAWKQHNPCRTMAWVVGSAAVLFASRHECSARRIMSYRINPVVDRPTFLRTHLVDTADWIEDRTESDWSRNSSRLECLYPRTALAVAKWEALCGWASDPIPEEDRRWLLDEGDLIWWWPDLECSRVCVSGQPPIARSHTTARVPTFSSHRCPPHCWLWCWNPLWQWCGGCKLPGCQIR